jgi:dipeptidyl aminopeptidase/acylaminoacyl peptidase
MRFVLAVSIAVAFATSAAHTAPKTSTPRAGTLTVEQLVGARGVGDVAISADGRRIAYVVGVPRAIGEEHGRGHAEIWVTATNGGEPRRYTPAKERAWAPAFSPDGKHIAFLSVRKPAGRGDDDAKTDINGLFVLPIDGGEARRLSDDKLSVTAFRWAPAGDRIAFTARDAKTEQEKKDDKEGRDQVVVGKNHKPARLYTIGVASGTQTRVTQDDAHVLGFDWAPDGTRLALRVADTPLVDEDYMYSRLVVVPAAGGIPAPLVRTEGKLGTPVFSPSGRSVAWLGATDLADPYAGSVFVAPAAGGAPKELTRGQDGCVTALAWWDDETLVVARTRSTATTLDLVSRQGGKSRTVLRGGPIFTEFALGRKGGALAFAGSTPEHPAEVFAGRLDRSRVRVQRLTTTNPDIERVQLGTQSVFAWEAADGLEIEGVLVEPLGFAAGRRHPLVVVVHGGPESCYRNGWITSPLTPVQLLARDGYLVFLPNYRASIGRDERFERADHGDLMGAEFDDTLAGIDALIARGWVDPARIGICGGSYGGYTTAWAATKHSERFAAAINFAGISNWISMQGTSDIPEENALVHWNRPFYSNMELYWERSPLAHVNACRTPMLILHGEKDERVPVSQGMELYTALRLLGREVEFVRYPREEHGLRESAHQLDAATRTLAWFARYLAPAPAVTRR